MRIAILTALLTTLAATSAQATDVPVRYTVDDKTLRAAVAGTDLTFRLSSDATCTNTVHSTTVAIDDVTIIARLKRFKPAGGVKPPKTAELHHTLNGVAATGSLYLSVTGFGVAPVGGSCQAQAAAVAGGGVGGVLVLKDSNGSVVGLQIDQQQVVRQVSGQMIVYGIGRSSFPVGAEFYFTSADCTGTALMLVEDTPMTRGFVVDGIGYGVPATGSMMSYASYRNARADLTSQGACDVQYPPAGSTTYTSPLGCCVVASATALLGPVATTEDLSAFVPPFVVEVQ